MTESKDELEIRSTCFDNEEPKDCLSRMRDADRKAADAARTIIEFEKGIRETQNKSNKTKTDELDVCMKKKQLAKMKEKHKAAVDKVLKLAAENAWNVEDLECRKIVTDQWEDDTQVEHFDPAIVVNNRHHGSKKNTILFFEPKTAGAKSNKNGNESICSLDDDDECPDQEASSSSGRCRETCHSNSVRRPSTDNLDVDFEKEAIRDDLLAMRGKMKLLHNQNRDLLCKLNSANERTSALSKNLRETKPDLVRMCKKENATEGGGGGGGGGAKNAGTDTKTKVLVCEIQRLRGLVKDMERDRCQIELAKQVLNLSESGCANCVGSTDESRNRLKGLTEDYKKLSSDYEARLSEIKDLRDKLDEAKHTYMTYEERLTISKEQIAQLEKQLFDLNWAKSNNSEVTSSDEKYVIENLRHHLHLANEEKSHIQMFLDFHTTELEDKKTKYLAVLQENEEQKHRIENLTREKQTIANEYDAEFHRLNKHLTQHLEQVGTLPAMLAATQRELETEKSAREKLTETVEAYKNQIDTLNKSIALDDHEGDERLRKSLEDEITQLKAKISNLNDNLDVKERLYLERVHYSLQLKTHLEFVREEAAMQVTKLKDFAECQKTKYTDYIQNLERQLAECRAVACAEFKKRDNIDERLRKQIEILTKNLDAAHKKIGKFVTANKLISTKMEEELCKAPQISVGKCVYNESDILKYSKD